MANFKQLVATEKSQFKRYALITAIAVIAVGILNHSNPSIFRRFLGDVNPMLVFVSCGVLGFLILTYLLSTGEFFIFKRNELNNILPYLGWTILFVTIAIWVDTNILYPKDTHIPWPDSLLFYPAMGFLVEIIFHLLPLSLLVLLLTKFVNGKYQRKGLWLSIIIVAMLEPIYQVSYMEIYPTWAIALIGMNLFLFNLTQLIVFRKYDFVSMFSLRVFYYLIWHISWGHFRLELLF